MSKSSFAVLRVGFTNKWKPINRFVCDKAFVSFFHQSIHLRLFLLGYLRKQKIFCSFSTISYNYGSWYICIYIYKSLSFYRYKYIRKLTRQNRVVLPRKGKVIRPQKYQYGLKTFLRTKKRWEYLKLRRFYTKSWRRFINKKFRWLDAFRLSSRYRQKMNQLFSDRAINFLRISRFFFRNGKNFWPNVFRFNQRINRMWKRFRLWNMYRVRHSVDAQPFCSVLKPKVPESFKKGLFSLPQLGLASYYSSRRTEYFGNYTFLRLSYLRQYSVNFGYRTKRVRVSSFSVRRNLNRTNMSSGLQPLLLKMLLLKSLYGYFSLKKVFFIFVWLQRYRLSLWRYLGLRNVLKALGRYRKNRFALNMVLLSRCAIVLRRPDLLFDYLNMIYRRMRLGQGYFGGCLSRCFKYLRGLSRFSGFMYSSRGRFGRSTRTSVRLRNFGRVPGSTVRSQLSFQYGAIVGRFGIFGVRLCWRYLPKTQIIVSKQKVVEVNQRSRLVLISNQQKLGVNSYFYIKCRKSLFKSGLLEYKHRFFYRLFSKYLSPQFKYYFTRPRLGFYALNSFRRKLVNAFFIKKKLRRSFRFRYRMYLLSPKGLFRKRLYTLSEPRVYKESLRFDWFGDAFSWKSFSKKPRVKVIGKTSSRHFRKYRKVKYRKHLFHIVLKKKQILKSLTGKKKKYYLRKKKRLVYYSFLKLGLVSKSSIFRCLLLNLSRKKGILAKKTVWALKQKTQHLSEAASQLVWRKAKARLPLKYKIFTARNKTKSLMYFLHMKRRYFVESKDAYYENKLDDVDWRLVVTKRWETVLYCLLLDQGLYYTTFFEETSLSLNTLFFRKYNIIGQPGVWSEDAGLLCDTVNFFSETVDDYGFAFYEMTIEYSLFDVGSPDYIFNVYTQD